MIAELLAKGAENAKPGKELARILQCDIRIVTEQIERERREGQPICANSIGGQSGYYIAKNPGELDAYCKRIHHRAGEMYKTRAALLRTLKKMNTENAE